MNRTETETGTETQTAKAMDRPARRQTVTANRTPVDRSVDKVGSALTTFSLLFECRDNAGLLMSTVMIRFTTKSAVKMSLFVTNISRKNNVSTVVQFHTLSSNTHTNGG